MFIRRSTALTLAFIAVVNLRAAEPDSDHPVLKGVTPVDDPAQAAAHLAVAPGLRADLWAAEPDLANPVSFSFDEHGRCFVAETFRRKSSTPDIRSHRPWLLPSLAMRSVADRQRFLEEAYADPKTAPYLGISDRNRDGRIDWHDLAVESERIRLLEDRAGKGRADHAEIFAEGFNTAVTGIGSGVLARGGDIYFTCLPDLWRLHDGRRESLLGGFGVHITYAGHDLHGVTMGPDGRWYWSVGDCGARIVTKEGGVIDVPDTGAVFRANPDGTECELVMRGLRNPEDLCFNDVGDLFTADNNADGGDLARWVQVVEGGDAGWQIGFQGLPGLGAWGTEQLWAPAEKSTAFALVPPVGTIGHGPAGVTHYPGTGLPEAWRDHFFVCDFPGGVRTFTLEKRGASYTIPATIAELHGNTYEMKNKLAWGFYPTDVEFGVEGGAYVLDWVRDEEKPGKGRIFRLHDPATDESALVRETKRLLGEGMAARAAEELAKWLGHADRRVRLAAQFALVEKGDAATLEKVARGAGERLARLHAVWGLGQLGRKSPAVLAPVAALLKDADGEVRAQAARVLGEARVPEPALVAALADAEPRVRFFAALALGKVGAADAVPALLAMLRENADADPFLRHASVVALAWCADAQSLRAAAKDEAASVRVAVLLAWRRQGSAEVAQFLDDPNPQLVLEAARAIYDTPIAAAMPRLAALTARVDLPIPVMSRAVNANFFLGDADSAARLATLANSNATVIWRSEAVEALGQWNLPLGRDRLLGMWRPVPVTRDSRAAGVELRKVLSRLLARQAGERMRSAAVTAVARLELRELEPALVTIAQDREASGALRSAALQTLVSFSSTHTAEVLQGALADSDPTLRAKALDLESRLQPEKALAAAAELLKSGSLAEKQAALRTIAASDGKAADKQLAKALDRCLSGELSPALHLDLFEAAAQRSDPAVKQKLASLEAARAPGRLGPWRECLQGGDAARGREIFCEKAEAGCLRCHRVRGLGGEVGPDLSAVGARLDRVSILKAIVFPNDTIAAGYENATVTLRDGTQLAGTVSAERDGAFTLRALADGRPTQVRGSEVAQRSRLPSPMPEGLGAVLGKRELRDVIEFLATQR